MNAHDAAPARPDTSAPSPTAGAGQRPWALVTGASSGIGEAFVDHLASHGNRVVLVARTVDKLQAVAAKVTAAGGEALVLPCDVADAAAREALIAELDQRGIEVDILVNNAGFGIFGSVAEADSERVLSMLEVNCAALTHFTTALLPGMLQRRRGTIINVASTASFQALPGMAAYAASKAYVRSFTEGLWGEVKGTGVRTIALCPGPTETAFFETAGDSEALRWRRTSQQVVDTCFKGLAAGKPTVVDGGMNVAQAIAPRLVPTRLAVAIAQRVVGKH